MIEIENTMVEILSIIQNPRVPVRKRIEMSSLLVDLVEHYRTWMENKDLKYPKETVFSQRGEMIVVHSHVVESHGWGVPFSRKPKTFKSPSVWSDPLRYT